jgi:hypothetical protein
MIHYDENRFKADETRSKKLLTTDAYGNPIEFKPLRTDTFWAVLDQRQRTMGASGKVISRHSDRVSAHQALKRTPHGRVVQLRSDMAVGELVHGRHIIPDNFARWS